jgi:ribonuclease HI
LSKLLMYSDGAARGNPGVGGIGVVLLDADGATVTEISDYIGHVTNNVAEYKALIRGLEEAEKLGATEIKAYVDSELLVKQLTGAYRVRSEGLLPLYQRVLVLKQKLQRFQITHVARKQNKRADALANAGIDNYLNTVSTLS